MTRARLKIVKHPNAMWYKDVGGKKSHLTCRLMLMDGGMKNMRYRLKASLYYESGKRLAEEWQWVLHFLEVKDGVIGEMSPSEKNAEVHFRIEKVSTSFMNQRFKVRFHLEPMTGSVKSKSERDAVERHSAVFTTPIESKAKPKRTTPRKRAGTQDPCSGNKRRRRNSTSTTDSILQNLKDKLNEMETRQREQDKVLALVLKRLDATLEKLNNLEDQHTLKRPTVERIKSDYALSKFGFDVSPERDTPDLSEEMGRVSPRKEVMSPRNVDGMISSRRFASDNSLFGIGDDAFNVLQSKRERSNRFLAMLS